MYIAILTIKYYDISTEFHVTSNCYTLNRIRKYVTGYLGIL
jgi:hypothetical protein